MKIFLTGGTGFVGKRILQDLLESNYQVRCLARKGSEQKDFTLQRSCPRENGGLILCTVTLPMRRVWMAN